MKLKIMAFSLLLATFISMCACANRGKEEEIYSTSSPAEKAMEQEESTVKTTFDFATSSQNFTQENSATSNALETSTVYIPRPKTPETLSTDIEEKIKEDYAEWENRKHWLSKIKAYNVMIEDYLGTYGGGEVVCITVTEHAYLTVIVEKNIAGYTLQFPSSAPYYFHKGTEFYTLEDAYAKGFLTKQDIRDIQWYLDDVQ